MHVIHTIAEFRHWRRDLPAHSALPFAPTMGALHAGHISLIHHARAIHANHAHLKVLSSIFVNPTQFAPSEDFAKYPRTLDVDLHLLEDAGCDAVFVPTANEMYPPPLTPQASTLGPSVDPGPLGGILEGALRPTHFAGVCTVVAKLLNIAAPTDLLLGQKDFQQQVILRHMAAALNFNVQVIACPTMREPDGLAMSSRNRYLPAEDRAQAPAIHEALQQAKTAIENGERSAARLEKKMLALLHSRGLTPQYATPRHPDTLAEFPSEITFPCVLLIAAKLGPTRLLDNLLLPAPAGEKITHSNSSPAPSSSS